MGKKTNTALVVGGVALLGYALYKSLGKPAIDTGGGVSGGGLISDILSTVGKVISPEEIAALINKPGGMPGGSEVGGQGAPPGGGSEGGGAYTPGAQAWQPTEGIISPLQSDYQGSYPALDVNEQGLFVSRESGQVYPVDPVSGRQRARIGEQGKVEGRYIASPGGIPYGTYEYSAPTETGEYAGAAWAKQTVISKATGISQAVITGITPSTGKSYTYFGRQGY